MAVHGIIADFRLLRFDTVQLATGISAWT